MLDLIYDDVWTKLSAAARRSGGPAWVAVAYFGQGAASQLPVRAGSSVVVDASDLAVKSGQTCPGELLKLLRRGVKIYSVANLHAKVYVFGSKAFVGSANVSKHSANRLVETMILTDDRSVVSVSRAFVRSLCRQRLTPELLTRLQNIYRPPRFVPAAGEVPVLKPARSRAEMPRFHIVQLERVVWTDRDSKEHDAGEVVARKRRLHGRGWRLESFLLKSQHPFRRGEMLMMVTEEGDGRYLLDVPGNVVHIRSFRVGARQRHIVYTEVPDGRRRRSLADVARRLGRGWKQRLSRDVILKNREDVDALLAYWNL